MGGERLYIFNSKIVDRDYSVLNVPLGEFKTTEEYGLNEDFYGGNVTHIASVKDSPIKLLINNEDSCMEVVDVATDNIKDIDIMSLKQYAKARGLQFTWTCTKDDIISLLESSLMKV